MPQLTLTVLDTLGIQGYIFGSNRLRENIGASHLVDQIASEWIREALPEPHNLGRSGELLTYPLEEHPEQQAELIYRGGGNVVVLSRSEEAGRAIVRRLSSRLLEEAPGLEIAAAHVSFDWEREALGGAEGAHARVMEALNQAKQQRRPSAPLAGQAVTLACRSTGVPAAGFDPDEEDLPLSAETLAKVDKLVADAAEKRLRQLLPAAVGDYALSRDFDHLGRSEGEMSYIAVVHADGNGIGTRLKVLAEQYPAAAGNRAYIEALRGLSLSIERAGQTALRRTVERMLRSFVVPEPDDRLLTLLADINQNASRGKPHLPFRPLVFGGDDVTFVCDGRLGLELARIYLEEFEQAARDLPGGPAYACAGIAVVKAHYPFARAYQLSVELTREAKHALRQAGMQGSALDWHFAVSGISGRLGEIRKREYEASEGLLGMRPVTLNGPGFDDWRSWEAFVTLVESFAGSDWAERRNKVIALRETLRAGKDATRHFRTAYSVAQLPPLPVDGTSSEYRETGWRDGRCVYFDAIEALDFYVPLAAELPQEED